MKFFSTKEKLSLIFFTCITLILLIPIAAPVVAPKVGFSVLIWTRLIAGFLTLVIYCKKHKQNILKITVKSIFHHNDHSCIE